MFRIVRTLLDPGAQATIIVWAKPKKCPISP